MADEYIRREDAVNDINEALKRVFTEHVGEGIINPLEPADVAPVRHAKWRHYEGMYACEACGAQLDDESPFCPMCGAKMDGKREKI